jgi:GT2 family glycosyltransferase
LRLSVIIVSYNVYPFLDNCIRSVEQALKGIEGEIIVVDNASVDRTVHFLHENFPSVKVIANSANVGFARANNQGISISRGEHILLLNPDTIVEEDTFRICLDFMDEHPEAGALGVKMLDGSGKFLPESKRGLPTLRASFMKMTGLYKIFPGSSTWNSYYQGHIGENETAVIAVLSGAFMFIRRKAIDIAGWLDEDFFMYGEDIDLSYRISKSGFKIYYLPKTNIIHYKGESTKKSSLNYILTFYEAMLTFTRKHRELRGQQFLIRVAIYGHGLIRFLKETFARWYPPLLDAAFFVIIFFFTSKLWATYYFDRPDYFSSAFYTFNIPLYTILTVVSFYINGAYDRPPTNKATWLGFLWAGLSILVIYAILPVDLRNSRMIILLGFTGFMLWLFFSRTFLPPWKKLSHQRNLADRKTIIVANKAESDRIKELINRSRDHVDIIGRVSPGEIEPGDTDVVIGQMDQLEDIVRVHKVKEIIYSAHDIPFTIFTSSMTKLGPGLRYMLAASGTMNIVGSMNKDTEGESYAIRVDFNLSHPDVKRSKRIFDVASSLVMILLYPLFIFIIPGARQLLNNILSVIAGRRTWVSYHPQVSHLLSLPPVKPGIVYPGYTAGEEDPSRRLGHIHYVYARDYHWTTDFSVMTTRWKKLGSKPHYHGR